jgi:phosphoenolpyruvate synthase/pyruvate phosphate dikinase
VDPGVEWVIPLVQAADCDERWIGGKAAKLAQLGRSGFRVPAGSVVTTSAYEHLIETRDLARLIRIELGRKPFASMRWEEVWDVALRIRSAFLAAPIPEALAQAIVTAAEALGTGRRLAVRSSAPGEG